MCFYVRDGLFGEGGPLGGWNVRPGHQIRVVGVAPSGMKRGWEPREEIEGPIV